MEAVIHLHVYYLSADYKFWSFEITDLIYSHFENTVLLKLVLWGVGGVAHFITGHEQFQLNQVCCFHFFGIFFDSKGSNCSELTYTCILYA